MPAPADSPTPSTPASAPLLSATIAGVAPHILQADNLGVTDDWRDLYHLLDYLCFAVDSAYPEIPCSKGCSHCCNNQLFRVTEAEWHVVRRGLAKMTEETRGAVFASVNALYGSQREVLEQMAAQWSRGELLPAGLANQVASHCPLLVEGRCSVYGDRPGICRGYGYFSATVQGTSSLLICKQFGPGWIQHLEASGVDQLPMPNWNPVQRKLEALSGGGSIKPLPLWLLDESAGEA